MEAKDFRVWHEKKRAIQNERPRSFFKEREVWFCSLGENIGFEQDGRGNEFLRPVIVLKKFNNETFWAVPLTKRIKSAHPYYYVFSFKSSILNSAIIPQLRFLDSKRLKYRLGLMSAADFSFLKIKVRQLLA